MAAYCYLAMPLELNPSAHRGHLDHADLQMPSRESMQPISILQWSLSALSSHRLHDTLYMQMGMVC